MGLYQTYQVSRISRETFAFWSHLPLTRRIIIISRISSIKFDQLILTKMVKIVAARCHILRLKYAPNSISAGAPPQNPLVQLTCSTLSDILAGFKGLYF